MWLEVGVLLVQSYFHKGYRATLTFTIAYNFSFILWLCKTDIKETSKSNKGSNFFDVKLHDIL